MLVLHCSLGGKDWDDYKSLYHYITFLLTRRCTKSTDLGGGQLYGVKVHHR